MDAELSAALIMFDGGDVDDLVTARERLRAVYVANKVEVPPSIRVRDIEPQSAGGLPVRVRLYEPTAAQTPVPALLWFHGGAFSFGFAELDDDLCVRLAADTGFVIASPDYRLAPEHPFPAGFNDCYETLLWLASNADILGIDADHIAVGGSSAGGALAAGVCLRARDSGGPGISQQILACPVIDDRLATPSMIRYVAAPIFSSSEAHLMWHRYLGDQREDPPRYAAPGREADLAGLPPAYILTADEDPLRDEGLDYAMRLLAAGNRTELHHVPDSFHSFDSIVPTAGVSQRVYQDYLAALARSRQG